MIEQTVLVWQIVHEMDHLFDVFVTLFQRGDVNRFGIMSHLFCHVADNAIQRGGKKHGLARFRCGGDDGFDIFDESHVEHAVGFIQNQYVKLVETDFAGLHVIDQTSRCSHQNIGIFGQKLHLFGIGHASENGDSPDMFQICTVLFGRSHDLRSQLACRCQNEHFWPGRFKAKFFSFCSGGLPLLIRGFPGFFGKMLHGKAVQGRKHECGGFAGTGL